MRYAVVEEAVLVLGMVVSGEFCCFCRGAYMGESFVCNLFIPSCT